MTQPTRRTVLFGLGATALVASCSSTDSPTANPSTTTTASAAGTSTTTTATSSTEAALFTSADFDGVGTCTTLPRSTAGPFGLAEQFVRRDITEDYPGHPLRLGLRVTNANCDPLSDAEVEIWHADATGDYSAFNDGGTGKDEGRGTTFLRGTQITDGDGIAAFETIVPGWYPGRAVHIHITIRAADGTERTGQLFFDEAFLAAVFAEPDYVANGTADTANAADFAAAGLSPDMLVQTVDGDTARGAGTVGLLNVAL